ncbi:MAG TPA: ABC transporter ATP-binding protein, partial [Polyangiaceae bacterium]|nr:ABC transporter ATP-binding protein [Polyangiaceae bacterium]
MNAVVLRDLVKHYDGAVALAGLNWAIPRGSICAVIGPNGSGKTTAFGLIAGLLIPDSGSIDLFGEGPFDPARHAGRVSLLPQDSSPSPHATLRQSLRYYAELQGLERAEAERQVEYWLERMHLSDRGDARQSQLSHGMRRRFSVAQAFLGSPELILLDEPTAGLDPELSIDLRALFREQRGRATLLISSHILTELEEICDHAVLIERGRTVRDAPMQRLRQADTLVRVTLTNVPDLGALERALAASGEHAAPSFEFRAPELRVRWSEAAPLEQLNARLLRALLDQGAGISSLEAG